MDIGFLDIGGLLGTIANIQRSGLVIGAVGARDQLLILALEREPSLKVVFFRGRIVKSTRYDRNNLVWNSQGLIKLLGDRYHLIKSLPRVFGFCQDKLFDLY